MKTFVLAVALLYSWVVAHPQTPSDSAALRHSLDSATAAIRTAFENGDAAMVGRLHSPAVIKYFGGNSVVVGREAVERGAREWFATAKVEFVENTVESTVFVGDVAIQSVIFAIKTTPRNGGKPTIGLGRSVVVYVRDKTSPTGWLTLREIAQAAPPRS